MAWEDRTPAEKAQARRAAREYRRTDDSLTYVVTFPGVAAEYVVTGINSARVVAGDTGTFTVQAKR